MTQHDYQRSGCCGNDQNREVSKLEKGINSCCGGDKDKKTETDAMEKPQLQGGGCCCGGGTK